ncbi:MAG: nucleotidyl transferase AbiEii/AbiGii toxin family protein [Candidatus Daviesbacteria bacterium]|nr:nucleotidyl transferase AbiEii/AbiGii toxin family protein [Candidatus Daviesbacteria bacterium]
MFTKTLSTNATASLALLGNSGILNKGYLAGGTACALQLGHRISLDLDFFTDKEFSTDLVLNQLSKLHGFKLDETEEWIILGGFPKVKFSYFYYPYPLIKKVTIFSKVNVSSLEDISAMKIAAVCERGTKRDFIDLYFLIKKKFSLDDILNFYDKKYKKLASNFLHIVKSLNYFDDAESQSMPDMLIPVSWDEVKKFFQDQVILLAKRKLGI